MNKKSFFAKRSELQKVDVLDIYIEKNAKKVFYKIKENKMQKIYDTENDGTEITIFKEIEVKLEKLLQEWYLYSCNETFIRLANEKYKQIVPLFKIARPYYPELINIKRYQDFMSGSCTIIEKTENEVITQIDQLVSM